MNPHPRIRKTIKWGGAAVTVLLVVVWLCSLVVRISYWPKTGLAFGAGQGLFGITSLPPGAPGMTGTRPLGLSVAYQFPAVQWWYNEVRNGSAWRIGIPIWPPAALSFLATAVAWVLDIHARRRARIGRCRKCNYDRTGLAAGAKCPECGAGAAVIRP